jgi:polycystin 1L2
MEVLSTTNTTYTQCISNHLTEFASGWIVVPNEINFNYVWSNASFTQNITIYITVIVISTIYFILMIWAQINDRNDMIKLEIQSFSSNKLEDIYFYQVTLSCKLPFNLKIKLLGTNCDSRIIEIDKRNSNLRYLLSSKYSLGKILNIEIFEKFKNDEINLISKSNFTIHNLLTREENYLHFNKSVKIFCIEEEKKQNCNKLSLRCIISNASFNLKEKHELISIFSKPLYSPFSRSDRLTCFFTLLFMALLMEIMYYDAEIETEKDNKVTSLTDGVFNYEITPQTVCYFCFVFL